MSRTGVPLKGVVWDVGNVIVRWSPRTLYSKIFPDEAEREWFLANVCTMPWHMRHDEGVSFAENRRPLLEQHPRYAEQIIAWETRWWEMFSGAIPETEAAIEALHARGAAQVGLTNMPSSVKQGTFAMSPAFARFRHIVVSGDVGLSKPDPRIFELAARHAGHAPAELLFVDDSSRNCEAAERVGYAAHHFTDPAALAPALAAHGLL
jgi:2-haloacid dehalogenase/putative hydrolase of the HAD superfamily